MEQGDLAPLPGLGRERDRLAEVLEPSGVPERGAGHAPGSRGRAPGGAAELRGEIERPVGDADRLLGPPLEGSAQPPR